MKSMFHIVCIAAFFTIPVMSLATDPPVTTAKPPTDYFPAVKQELARLQTAARCNDITQTCTLDAELSPQSDSLEVTVRYSNATDTVYAFIDKFLVIPRGETPSPELTLKLLTLNGELVTSKFEWQASSNSIRLSTVMSCDSNFDRRAFRSQYTGLLKVAKKLRSELLPETVNPSDNEKSQSEAPSESP